MCNNRRFGLVLAIIILGGGTWLLAQQFQDSSPKLERQTVVYSVCNPNNGALMLDVVRGKTWMLRRLEDGKPTWLAIPRIDSEAEAAQLWRKSSDYKRRTNNKSGAHLPLDINKSGAHLPLDILLEERGYLGIPLDRLKAGYLGIEVRIEGKKVYLMLDTGAPVTHLDIERTKHLQLKWQPWNEGDNKKPAAGARSFCEIAKLEIGSFEVKRLIIAGHNESELNKLLKLYLDPPIDGELGSDVLTKLNAIIDYSTLKLYIRPMEPQEKKEGEKKKGGEKKR